MVKPCDDELAVSLAAKDVTPSTMSTSGRKVSSEPGKEAKRRNPNLRKSSSDAYVRKVADWLEAGGPRGSIEQMLLYSSETNGEGNVENDDSTPDVFDSTMYFDSTQTWDLDKALQGSQHSVNGGNGRFQRWSVEGLRESRFSDKRNEHLHEDPLDRRTDLTQDFTEIMKYEDPLEHLEGPEDDGGAKDDREVSPVSQSDSLSGTDAAVPICEVDASSSFSPGRSSTNEVSTGVSLETIKAIDCASELLIDDYTRIIRVQSDAEAIKKNPGELVIALNAGSDVPAYSSCGVEYLKDQKYVGGTVLRTGESIVETAEQALYQTARYGNNIAYSFTDLSIGNYFVDLHFAEIIFTNGPSGMRVFDVYIQGEKVISDLDIYGEVGSNKALVLCTAAGVVDGSLNIAFQGVASVPIVSAICVRKAPFSGTILPIRSSSMAQSGLKPNGQSFDDDYLEPVEVEHKSRRQQAKSKGRVKSQEYEASLESLRNECHQAWISLEEANRSSEKMQNELVAKSVAIGALENVVETQETKIRDLEGKAEGSVQKWRIAFSKLHREIQDLKANYAPFATETKDWILNFPDSKTMINAVHLLVAEHDDLKKKYAEESLERRQLYNKVLELKGNIRVFCRCRPLSPFEVSSGASAVVEFEAVKDNELIVRQGNTKKLFKFDQVFTPHDDQGEVFANTAPVVVSVLDGYNVCIFAYGQTGTGKTFTMEGTPENRGVNYRTLEELFHVADQRRGQFNYEICVSVLEVYNEQIRDLLAPPAELDHPVKKLEIRQVAEGGHHVPGLVEAQVHSMTQVWDVLQSGSSARAVESTNSNEHSSRSHCMLCVMVKGQNLITGECTRSKLWLVDLAGSERVAKSDVHGDRLREAQSINKSLSALGDVISALTTKSSHIPFRNSKLTHLLQDSLGGDSKTLMFVQISPNEDDVGETICSLNFASRVRGVELGPARKQLDSSELFKYKQLVERGKQEGRTKEEALKKVEETLRSMEVKLKVKEHQLQTMVDKMKEKDKTLADLAKEKADLETQLAAERRARLAATAALKDKGSQPVERAAVREVKISSDKVAERRPLEKLQDFSDAPTGRAGVGSPFPHVKEVAENEKPRNENSDPQHTEAPGETPVVKPPRTKVVPSRYNSPTLSSRNVIRKPMRASIASPYMINPATLTSSFSSDEFGQDGSKENARVMNDSRDVQSSVIPSKPHLSAIGAATGVSTAAQRRAVTFASPVFQRAGEVKQKEPSQQQPVLSHVIGDSDRSISLGGPADAKKVGVGKLRRVSIARTLIKREGSTFGVGAQRVLSSAAASSRRLSTVVPHPQSQKRWNK
ncbi:hypothetical protein R1flu_013333 [Riccia fluitans]|uniref:Kinesin motor domain-containing protein n=1 Tax=Riccia fluitans TaxID=41844 RepID=A0ABD1YG49_9MARC